MYDVVYLDRRGRQNLVGSGLPRATACELAMAESRRRHVGRMFLAGSEQDAPRREQVLIVESARRAA
ncbi:MAG: hypothetical protein ABR536_04380 [Solirubrobacterales bacterium]